MTHAIRRRHWRVPALTLATLFVLPILFWTSTLAQTKKPINKDGLVEAIRLKGYTARELIKQIETRGVSFEMSSEIEAEMRRAGAQPELIEAARANYRPNSSPNTARATQFPRGTGALKIYSTVPGCEVFLNGVSRGLITADGTLGLPLKAGRYKVTLKKENFEEQERTVTIASGNETTEGFTLTALQGRLTVNSNVPDAEVKLDGVAYPNGVKDLSMPARTYELRVSKQGFRPLTKTVVLNARGSVTVDAPLEPVPIEEYLAQAVSYLQTKRYPEAISSGRAILASHPDNAKAYQLVGLAYYFSDQYSESLEFLAKAVTLGELVVLPVKHHHSAFLSDDLCTGRITIGRGTLAFTSVDRTGHDFTVPAGKILELTPEPRKFGRVHVRVGIQNGTKEDKKTYNFHVIRAYLIRANANDPSSITFVRCDNCDQETSLIYQLLRNLKDTSASSAQSAAGTAAPPALKRRPAELDSSDRPTLTRRPLDSSDAVPQPSVESNPQLAFVGRENYQAGGQSFTRYKLNVTNRAAYSDDMFASAPDLPPCGLNTKSPRTWVDIFDRAGKRLYGFCAFNSADALLKLWFALPEGQAPPSEVFIVLVDRRAKKEYKSNLVAIQ